MFKFEFYHRHKKNFKKNVSYCILLNRCYCTVSFFIEGIDDRPPQTEKGLVLAHSLNALNRSSK